MKNKKMLLRLVAPAVALLSLLTPAVSAAEPLLDSWQTSNTRRYARIYQNDAARLAGTAVTTWTRGTTSQTTPSYAGVTQVSYSANWVYLRTSGLGTHVMGPWYLDTAHTMDFPGFPANTGFFCRIPRTPTIPTTKTLTNTGTIGYSVDGVSIFDFTDTFSYVNSTGADFQMGGGNAGGGAGGPPAGGGGPPAGGGGPPAGGGGGATVNGDGIWIRDAYHNEGVTFDPAFAHQAMTLHHYHANMPAVRFQLGDNVDFNSTTKIYTEKTTTPVRHSPIVGWMGDGLPVYGPYGYGSPMNAASPVRRMISGYVKRDGANGTTNLAATGRTTLPKWAVTAQNRTTATLTSTQTGPAVNANFALGHYLEDHDYLGDLGKTLGTDFDLNLYNVRFCMTPEFPDGTWAYFLTIETDGTPMYPYIVGRWFYGSPTGGNVTTLTETVTEHVRASQASPISVNASNANGTVSINWTSVEGATYKIETSPDATTWSALASAAALTSSGGDTTTFTTATVAANYRVTLTALATYDTDSSGGLTGVGNTASATVGSTGTARLINISTRAAIGGTAGTPIPAFVLAGTGTKQMLVRAVGPTLTAFGVTGVLADPRLSLISGTTTVSTNDNWLTTDSATFAASGAFALTAASRDAALVATIGAGSYSAPVTATDNGSGVALLEVYDAATSSALRVVNASTRAVVGTGDSVLIPAFVVSGTGSLKLLVRAVGPTLGTFGVTGALADPTITLYRGTTVLSTNDNWLATDAATMSAVGAFALPAGSRDAAIVATLAAGTYTAIVSGVGNTTGTALVEIYIVP
jgi:hypothetical protein